MDAPAETCVAAGAPAGEKANADPPTNRKKRKLPSTFSASANAGVSAGSSGDKKVSAKSKKTEAGPGKNRKAKIDAMMSCVTKVDEAANPDDALALRNPEDDLIPDLPMAGGSKESDRHGISRLCA